MTVLKRHRILYLGRDGECLLSESRRVTLGGNDCDYAFWFPRAPLLITRSDDDYIQGRCCVSLTTGELNYDEAAGQCPLRLSLRTPCTADRRCRSQMSR